MSAGLFNFQKLCNIDFLKGAAVTNDKIWTIAADWNKCRYL
jgi:hypothetical protein